MNYRLVVFLWVLCCGLDVNAQRLQVLYDNSPFDAYLYLPAADYSGISWMGDNRYALVSDKEEGIHIVDIELNQKNGKVKSLKHVGFVKTPGKSVDMEDIVYVKPHATFFIASEALTEVREYDSEGCPTGRQLSVPDVFKNHIPNRGIEALAYHEPSGSFWLTSESTLKPDCPTSTKSVNCFSERLRLQRFTKDLKPSEQYAYLMDSVRIMQKKGSHVVGVSALAALDDGRLLVLERDAFITKNYFGSSVECKLYIVDPSCAQPILPTQKLDDFSPYLPKQLLCKWNSHFSLFDRSFANYEGLCLGPKLADGSQVLLLITDSQSQYKDVLSDYVKTIVIAPVNDNSL